MRYFVLLLGLLMLFVGGCDSDDEDTTRVSTVLTGSQVVPPVVTTTTGTGRVDINVNRTFIDARLETGVFASSVQQATINYGAPNEEGPVMFTLYNAQTDGNFPDVVTRRLTAANLATQPPGSPIASFADAVNAILAGTAYMTVLTITNPEGEIRGQLDRDMRTASLRGGFAVPPAITNASGTATAVPNNAGTALFATLQTNSAFTSPVLRATINAGRPGTNGPVLFTLFDANLGGSLPGALQTTLTAADFESQPPGSPVANFNAALNAIANGHAYVLITTQQNPNGEIRGNFGEVLTFVK